jgi:autotransporter adhesin
MAIRDTDTHNLKVRTSSSFSDTIIKDVADPVDDTDAVNLRKLNATAIAGGWDEAVWDDETGDLKFNIDEVLDETVNLDGRYTTESEVQDLIDAQGKTVFSITLPSGATVAERVAGVIDKPDGWTLEADGLNLDIIHNLNRYTANVTVWAVNFAAKYQKLEGTAAHNGITMISTELNVLSLATILKQIRIFVTIE